jgi:hypothetical protein
MALFFSISPEQIDGFIPSWDRFKNSVIEIGLLHLQSFTNNHFHFFTVVELVTFQVLPQRPKQMEV